MMRSYLGLSLSFCLMFAVGCDSGTGGTGGTAGTGATAGSGGAGGSGGVGGSGGGVDTVTIEKELALGCANSSPLGAQSILSATLSVTAPTAIAASAEFDAILSGTSTFPEAFLDTAQDLVPGGLSRAKVTDIRYVVQVRSGATMVDVALTADSSMVTPGPTQFCTYPPTTVCTEDGDCTVPPCTDPVLVVDVPTSDDCDPGGVCDELGKTDGPTSQCVLNDFCVTGDLDLPLVEVTQAYTADATGEVLFGWADEGLSNNTFDSVTELFAIPKPSASDPIEQGIKVDANLVVSVECVMGVDGGTDPGDPENTLVGLTPDVELISFPIQ